jgi:hypothetical protein
VVLKVLEVSVEEVRRHKPSHVTIVQSINTLIATELQF